MPVNAPVVAASGSWTRKLVDLSTVWRSSMRLGFRKVETAAFQGIDERARWNCAYESRAWLHMEARGLNPCGAIQTPMFDGVQQSKVILCVIEHGLFRRVCHRLSRRSMNRARGDFRRATARFRLGVPFHRSRSVLALISFLHNSCRIADSPRVTLQRLYENAEDTRL
jgi:hypothetical protein